MVDRNLETCYAIGKTVVAGGLQVSKQWSLATFSSSIGWHLTDEMPLLERCSTRPILADRPLVPKETRLSGRDVRLMPLPNQFALCRSRLRFMIQTKHESV